MKLIIIGGKARHGKTTTAGFIKDYLEEKGIKAIKTSLAKYLKVYAKDIINYNEEKDEKPRTFLQELGKTVREIDRFFLLKRLDEDILIYEKYADFVIIDDIRLAEEVEYLKKYDCHSIKIIRSGFEGDLTEKQKKDETEKGLDNYNQFDIELLNDGSLDDLSKKIKNIMGEIV